MKVHAKKILKNLVKNKFDLRKTRKPYYEKAISYIIIN